jgi:hypothetical protein
MGRGCRIYAALAPLSQLPPPLPQRSRLSSARARESNLYDCSIFAIPHSLTCHHVSVVCRDRFCLYLLMSSSRRKPPVWSDLTMTAANQTPDSAESTPPSSPTQQRGPVSRSHSGLGHDERTPLLKSAGRSRIRLQSAALEAGTARNPRLLRHASHNGNISWASHSQTYAVY